MKLTDIFQRLGTGPLQQARIGDNAIEGQLNASNYQAILPLLNAGMVALHTRFLLKRKEAEIVLVGGQTTYTLTDSELLQVEAVTDQLGRPLALNDPNDLCSLRTRSLNVLYVPPAVVDVLKVTSLTVSYRVLAAPIPGGIATDEELALVEVDLPLPYLEPLVYYVAWQLFNPRSPSENFHEGSHYAQLYEAACTQLEGEGLELDDGLPNDRLWRNGWV